MRYPVYVEQTEYDVVVRKEDVVFDDRTFATDTFGHLMHRMKGYEECIVLRHHGLHYCVRWHDKFLLC